MTLFNFGFVLILLSTLTVNDSQEFTQKTGFVGSNDDNVIIMIQPRAENDGHEVNTLYAEGEVILTILNNNNEIVEVFNVTAPLENFYLDTRAYTNGTYLGKLTLDGSDYFSNAFEVSN